MITTQARTEYRNMRRRVSANLDSGVTRRLAENVANIQYGGIPSCVIASVKAVVMESLGTMMEGAVHDTSRKVLRYVTQLGGTPHSTILYYGDKTNMVNAALVNGTFCFNATESVVIPAALAVAEKIFANGHEFLTAIIAGWEVMLRLEAAAASTVPVQRPLHPLSTFGPFGAAVAAAKLLRLDVDALEDTLTCCTAQAAGTLQAQVTGSESERLVPGFSASYGVMAARMSRQGISGARDILEGRAGFYMCIAGLNDDGTPKYEIDMINAGFGENWSISDESSVTLASAVDAFRVHTSQVSLPKKQQDTVIKLVKTLEVQDDVFTLLSNLTRH